jgi:adenine-specific DNA-methyltransferase
MPKKIFKKFNKNNLVTLFNGDCLDFLKTIPNNSVQLVITSPPYNIGKVYEKKQKLTDYLIFQEKIISECVRVLSDGGSICWQVGHHKNGHGQIIPLDLLIHPIFDKFEKTENIYLRNRIIWHFEHGLNCDERFSGRHETILWFTKGDNYIFNLDDVRVPQKYPGKRAYKGPKKGQLSGNPLGKNPGDVWIFPNVKGNHIEKTIHPCQFPTELPERLILALTNEKDLILDPFIGVGTTGIAAVINKRKVAGSEIRKQYIKIAQERITKALNGKLEYRPIGKPVYIPDPNTKVAKLPMRFLKKRKKNRKLFKRQHSYLVAI